MLWRRSNGHPATTPPPLAGVLPKAGRPMRVGIDAHLLDGKYQGSRTWLENILPAIGKLDRHNQYFIYSFNEKNTAQLLPFSNFEHRQIMPQGAIPRFAAFWPFATRRDRLDIMISQYIAPFFTAAANFVVLHDILFESHPSLFPLPMRWRLKLFARWSAKRAARVFTVSAFSRDEIVRRYLLDPARVLVVQNGRTTPCLSPAHAQQQAAALQPFLLCVGRLEPRKNIALVLRATERARRNGVRLVVVGRGDYGVRRLVQELARSHNVSHLVDVEPAVLSALYRHATAVVFPSLAEGFGLPVLEGLSHGATVIASNRTSIPEVGGPFATYFNPLDNDAERTLADLIEAVVPISQPAPNLPAHLAQFDWTASALTLVDAVNHFVP